MTPTPTEIADARIFPARALDLIEDAGERKGIASRFSSPREQDVFLQGIEAGMAILLGHSTDDEGLGRMVDRLSEMVGR